jgi:hypothetical protein
MNTRCTRLKASLPQSPQHGTLFRLALHLLLKSASGAVDHAASKTTLLLQRSSSTSFTMCSHLANCRPNRKIGKGAATPKHALSVLCRYARRHRQLRIGILNPED